MNKNCNKCGRPMHHFHDCKLNPVANPSGKYSLEEAARFCKEYLDRPVTSFAGATIEEIDAGLFRMRRDGIIYEAMKTLRDSGTDPVDLLRAALNIVDSDAMVIVNRMPEALS